MNFPEPCRTQRLLFINERIVSSRENLNSTSLLIKMGTTTFRTSFAHDTDDDTCIFHPCMGGRFLLSSGGKHPNQTPFALAKIMSLGTIVFTKSRNSSSRTWNW